MRSETGEYYSEKTRAGVDVRQVPSLLQLSRGPTVGIFGFYGNENLGDEAIIEATIAAFRERDDSTDFICFSVNPGDSRTRYGVESISIVPGGDEYVSRRQEMELQSTFKAPAHDTRSISALERTKALLKRSRLAVGFVHALRLIIHLPSRLRAEYSFVAECAESIQQVDLLVIAGSNQFLDNFGGPWRFPYTLFRWTWLARKKKIPTVMLSVGAGPVFSKLSWWMITRSIKRSDYVSFRDDGSARLLGYSPNQSRIYPDLAFSLQIASNIRKAAIGAKSANDLTIGVNPMAVHASGYWYKEDPVKYERYVSQLAAYVTILASQGQPFTLIANQPRDELVIADVVSEAQAQGCPEDLLQQSVRHSSTVAEYMEVIAEADIIVATRFHATVLALAAGKPVLGLCYYRKAKELLSEFDQQEFIFDVDAFEASQLNEQTRQLALSWRQASTRIKQQADEYEAALKQQFDEAVTILAASQVPDDNAKKVDQQGSLHA